MHKIILATIFLSLSFTATSGKKSSKTREKRREKQKKREIVFTKSRFGNSRAVNGVRKPEAADKSKTHNFSAVCRMMKAQLKEREQERKPETAQKLRHEIILIEAVVEKFSWIVNVSYQDCVYKKNLENFLKAWRRQALKSVASHQEKTKEEMAKMTMAE